MYANYMDFKKCLRSQELSNAASISVQLTSIVVLNVACTLRGYKMGRIPRNGDSYHAHNSTSASCLCLFITFKIQDNTFLPEVVNYEIMAHSYQIPYLK